MTKNPDDLPSLLDTGERFLVSCDVPRVVEGIRLPGESAEPVYVWCPRCQAFRAHTEFGKNEKHCYRCKRVKK